MVRGDLRIDLRKDQNLEGGSLDRLLKKEDLALRREDKIELRRER